MFPIITLFSVWIAYFAYVIVRAALQRRNSTATVTTVTTPQQHNGNVADVVATAQAETTERGGAVHDETPERTTLTRVDEVNNIFEWDIN